MSAAPNPSHTRATLEEYLEIDANSDVKHEFINGEIVMFAGTSIRHSDIKGNVEQTLAKKMRDGCKAHSSDLRVYAPGIKNHTYPDVVVVCGERELRPNVPDTLTNPVFIAEILSPTTEKEDLGPKTQGYLKIPALRHLLLISQYAPYVIVYERQDAEHNAWLRTERIGLSNTIALEALSCELVMEEIYAGLSFDNVPSD